MSSHSNIRRNSLFVFLTNAFRLLSNVALFVIIARFYGPAEFGQFAAIHVLATVFLIVADFGFDVLLIAKLPQHPREITTLTSKYFSTKLLSSFIASISFVAFAMLGRVGSNHADLALVFALYVFSSALVNFFCAFFKSMELMEEETKVSFVMNSFLLAGGSLVAAFSGSMLALASIFSLSRLLGLLSAVRRARRIVPQLAFKFTLIDRKELESVWVFGLHALLGTLYFVQDTLLLSHWSDSHNVGIYQAMFKLVSVSLLPGDVLIAATLPILSRLTIEDSGRWLAVGKLLHKTLFYVALIIGSATILFADSIVAVVYGPEYQAEGPAILRMLAVVVVLRYASDGSGAILTSSNRQVKRLTVVGTAVILNFFLNWYLIPLSGARGAATASLLTGAYVACGYIAYAWKDVRSWFREREVYLVGAFAVVMGFFTWWTNLSDWVALPLVLGLLTVVTLFKGYSDVERRTLFSPGRISSEVTLIQ
ncbi:MAG TPA: oligosaccharide flippase family protein [Nitrososphaera sp.]|nr:oligosaccharide flippase family protein [Nitrososphaera sp.]